MPSIFPTVRYLASALLASFFLDYTFNVHLYLPIVSASQAYLQTQHPFHDNNAFESWLRTESQVATQRLLQNTFPSPYNNLANTQAQSIAPGTIIASPSRDHPNYFFQWVRDAALCVLTYLDLYQCNLDSSISSTNSNVQLAAQDLEDIFNHYATLQQTLQRTSNPSGSFNPSDIFNTLSALGEPKFNVNGTAYTDPWGRPQHDGPALRALALMRYVRLYNSSHPELWNTPAGDTFYSSLYEATWPPNSIIKADLEYTARYWREPGFDLWEEVKGSHFFTAMVQYRALREAAIFARVFEDEGAGAWYEKQANLLEDGLLGRFWDETKRYVKETIDGEERVKERSGLDCAVLLGSLHGVADPDAAVKESEEMYAPWSDEILLSLLAFSKDQEERFEINRVGRERRKEDGKRGADPDWALRGVGLGRYPEDVYDGYGDDAVRGGNPWFLCTSSAAEVLYRSAAHFLAQGNVTVSSLGLPFFEALLEATLNEPIELGFYDANSVVFQAVVEKLREMGDEYLQVLRRHATREAALSEQFDRDTGFERGAADLSWSYGAFLGAVRSRERPFG